MSPDWAAKPVTVPYAKFGDPQSLNLYSYTENGPVNRIDSDGHSINALDDGNPGFSDNFGNFENRQDCSTLCQAQPQQQQHQEKKTSQRQQQVIGQVPGATNQPIPDSLFLGLSGPPQLATTPSLTITTAGGGPDSGGSFWNTLFKLDPPSADGGWIIQQIIPSSTVAQTYWEAWRVNPGSQYTEFAEAHGKVADDYWSARGVTASATFYEGLQKLPDLFRGSGEFGHVPQSGSLPSTYYDPTSSLPPDRVSNTVTRSFP